MTLSMKKIAFLLFGFSLALRIVSSASYFFTPAVPEYHNFEMFDSTYQFRRAELTAQNFPHVPFYDPMHYFPENPRIPWPVGYTLILGTLDKALSTLHVSPLSRQTAIGLVPCLFDAVTVVLFFFFFSRFVRKPIALGGAILLACSSQNIGYSEIGYIDHHFLISFLVALWCVGLWFFQRGLRRSYDVLFGVAIGLGPFFNVSTIQYGVLVLACVMGWAWINRQDTQAIRRMHLVFLGAAIGTALSAWSTPAGQAWEIRYDETSWFQFFIILTQWAAATAAAVYSLLMESGPPASDRRGRLLLRAGVVLSAGAALFFLFLITKDIFRGAEFLLKGNRLNWIQGEEASIRDYAYSWPYVFTAFVFLLPWGLKQLWEDTKEQPFFQIVFGLFFGYGLFTALPHYLYVQYLYPWYALAAAAGFWAVWHWAAKRHHLLALTVSLIFVGQLGFKIAQDQVLKLPEDRQFRMAALQTAQAFDWLRQHSPEDQTYSVMAHRDHGHQIVHFANRSVVTSPFSTPAFLSHLQDYARLTLSPNEATAVTILERYRSRYWVLDNRDNATPLFWRRLLEDLPDFFQFRPGLKSSEIPFLFRNNLLFFDGELRWRKTPSVQHFRLIYETPAEVSIPLRSKGKLMKHTFHGLKIFERVPGALLIGKGFRPDTRVVVSLPQTTNTGRTWTYTAFGIADPRGRVSITVPYSSAATPYTLNSDGRSARTIAVSESAVQNAETIPF